jgi:hypothetical protein
MMTPRLAAVVSGALLIGPVLLATGLRAAPATPQESTTERRFSDYSPTQDKRSLLDVANPLELMNRLRNLSSMDNATSPGDAIDRALKQLDQPSGARPSAPVRPVAP